MKKVYEFKRRYHLHKRYLCLVHWIHNMLLKKEDTSGELRNNSKMLVNMCRAPLATDSHQPMHAKFPHDVYIILIRSHFSFPCICMGNLLFLH